MAVLLRVGATRSAAFKAFDCNNASAPIEQYSLLDPEPCGNMQKVHAIERDLHGSSFLWTRGTGLFKIESPVDIATPFKLL